MAQALMMTHTGKQPQGLQFARDTMQGIQNAPGNILKWAQNNPWDAAFMGASTLPVVGDAIGLGKDAYDMSPMGDVPFNVTNVGLAGLGALPFVPAGMGAIKKAGGDMVGALGANSPIHDVAKQGKKYLEDIWGVPSNKSDLNLSTNRNNGKSAYLSGPFGEIRISDHSSNPDFMTSSGNIINPSFDDLKAYLDDAMSQINKGRMKGNNALDAWELPRSKMPQGWEGDFQKIKQATSKEQFASMKDDFMKKYSLSGNNFKALMEAKPNYRRSETYSMKQALGGTNSSTRVPAGMGSMKRALGDIPMDEASRMGRAKEMGFDVNRPVYHGTNTDFNSFDPERSIGGQYWSTTDRDSIETGSAGAQGKGVIKEMYQNIKNPAGWDEYDKFGVDELIARGYDGLALPDTNGNITYTAFYPNQYRDVKAAFDPAKRKSANLMAGIGGTAIMANALQAKESNQ